MLSGRLDELRKWTALGNWEWQRQIIASREARTRYAMGWEKGQTMVVGVRFKQSTCTKSKTLMLLPQGDCQTISGLAPERARWRLSIVCGEELCGFSSRRTPGSLTAVCRESTRDVGDLVVLTACRKRGILSVHCIAMGTKYKGFPQAVRLPTGGRSWP
jgi:hypothetical protein